MDVGGETGNPLKNALVPSEHVTEGCGGKRFRSITSKLSVLFSILLSEAVKYQMLTKNPYIFHWFKNIAIFSPTLKKTCNSSSIFNLTMNKADWLEYCSISEVAPDGLIIS